MVKNKKIISLLGVVGIAFATSFGSIQSAFADYGSVSGTEYNAWQLIGSEIDGNFNLPIELSTSQDGGFLSNYLFLVEPFMGYSWDDGGIFLNFGLDENEEEIEYNTIGGVSLEFGVYYQWTVVNNAITDFSFMTSFAIGETKYLESNGEDLSINIQSDYPYDIYFYVPYSPEDPNNWDFMGQFFTAIENVLDGMIPLGAENGTSFGTFNEVLTYFIIISLFYLVLVKPLLRLIKVVK